MNLLLFLYGTFVFGLVAVALTLIAWGIVNERRDRLDPERARRVFGEPGASAESARQREEALG
jgi:hypothetical protein